MRFACEPYRESGVSILSGVDDIQVGFNDAVYVMNISISLSIQVMLDDHILKAQTMHSSAYIKPFEEEMKEWEDKLISMQAIPASHFLLSISQLDVSMMTKLVNRTYWMLGCDVKSRGSISSQSSTARTS